MMRKISTLFFFAFMVSVFCVFSQKRVEVWLSMNDKSVLLTRQKPLDFSTPDTNVLNIQVKADRKYQQIDGFGFALTGGSAQHMIHMSPSERKKLIHELFAVDGNSIGISYLRVSIGSSDLNDHVFSYDDVPEGQTDIHLDHFSLKEDEKDVIPILKEILEVNPNIKILGSPWSAPVWMKTNHNIQGGKLKEEYYPVYAGYFVNYINGMKQHGITIDAITVQNEPFNDGNTPSMQLFAKEELTFIKNFLGPVFAKSGIKTKIILYDHNCDAPEYPVSILTDTDAAKYIDGSGFHLYAGPVSAMTKVHDAFPQKNLYFTEMMVTNRKDFAITSPVDWIMIGAMRNWSRNVILWNLAADPGFNPHTNNGGCSMCQGAITIDGDKVDRNLAFYTVAHFSKFVPDGSVRIESSECDGLSDVAFVTPAGKTVLVVVNKSGTMKTFNVIDKNRTFHASLNNGSVATYTW